MAHMSWADDKQIKLDDIERDTLIEETERTAPQQHQQQEQHNQQHNQQPTQHIQLTYSNDPQDIFVTPMPGRYAPKGESISWQIRFSFYWNVESDYYPDSPAELRSQIYHLPKVHENDQTYTVPAKQTLLRPIIGGSQPIQPVLAPQPQYIYIQSPQHHHQPYMPQAQ